MGLLDSAGKGEATGGFEVGTAGSGSRMELVAAPASVPAIVAAVIPPIIPPVVPPVVAPLIPVIPAVVPAVPAPFAIVVPVVEIVVVDPVEPATALVEPNPVPAAAVLIEVPVAPPIVVDHDHPCFPAELLEPAMIEAAIPDPDPLDPAYVPGTVIVPVPAISDDDPAADRPATNADVRLHALRCCRGRRKQGQEKGGAEY